MHCDKLGGTGQPIMKIFYPCYITACSIALLNWQNKSGSRARRHSAVLVPGAALLATLHCDASPFKMDNEFSSAYQQSNKPINTIYLLLCGVMFRVLTPSYTGTQRSDPAAPGGGVPSGAVPELQWRAHHPARGAQGQGEGHQNNSRKLQWDLGQVMTSYWNWVACPQNYT